MLQLFRIIDWMMDLPELLEQLFKQEAEQIEQEKHMPYVTSVERLAIREARAEMLIRAVARRFQVTVPEDLAARIRATTEQTTLERWLDLAYAAASLEDFRNKMLS